MATNSITLNDLEMYTNDKTYIGYYENVHEMKSRNDEENDEFIIKLPKGCELTKDDFEQRECFRIVMQNYIIKADTIKVKFGDEECVELITYKKDNKKNREIDYFYYDDYDDYTNLFKCYDEVSDWYAFDNTNEVYYIKYEYVKTSSDNLVLNDNLYLVTQDMSIERYETSPQRTNYINDYNFMKDLIETNEYEYYFKKGYYDHYCEKEMKSYDDFSNEFGDIPEAYGQYYLGYNIEIKDGYTDYILYGDMENIPELKVNTFTSITFPAFKIKEKCSIGFPSKTVIVKGQFVIENDGELICGTLEC